MEGPVPENGAPAPDSSPVPVARAWQEGWFASAGSLSMQAWRGVESQRDISTLRLVDSTEEHDLLEQLLERSKPPLPEGGRGLHYLLFTPFRYTSPEPSRFRRRGEPGVWYGADSLQIACAEIAYWRYRFVIQSAGLARDEAGLLTSHTLFSAGVDGVALDLASPPWSASAGVWTHPSDYAGTQDLAAQARSRGIQWIRYASVRQPGSICAAVLAVSALAGSTPSGFQEWQCRATRHRVLFHHRDSGSRFSWDF